jgi:bacteriorhodopsin
VIAFGGMILLYAVLLMIFTVIPSWFSSVLFILFGVTGVFFTPGLFADISLTSRYLLMAIGVFLFAFGHYFTLKRNIAITPIIHTLSSLGLLALNRPGTTPLWAILAVSLLT